MVSRMMPRDALTGVRLAFSASPGDDLERLGLTQAHFRPALGELARAVLIGGGTLAYGGRLQADELTTFLMEEVRRYGKPDQVNLRVYQAWSAHRRLPLKELEAARKRLGIYGEIVCLDPDGARVEMDAGRKSRTKAYDVPPAEVARSLTAMRRVVTAETQGRLVLGGKRLGHRGRWPGVLEEAVFALEAGQPLYLAAGFGGVTADIAAVLGLPMDWLTPAPAEQPADPGLDQGMVALRQAAGRGLPDTGLSASERARLAATHRPSEVASLVSLGLGRRFGSP
ncbi:MAG: hypothetical protein LDL44_12410 [Caenispirillum sp.]|nr:hypothetical protein [Caenispirillum sp.]